jgi:hypothetical protein
MGMGRSATAAAELPHRIPTPTMVPAPISTRRHRPQSHRGTAGVDHSDQQLRVNVDEHRTRQTAARTERSGCLIIDTSEDRGGGNAFTRREVTQRTANCVFLASR